MFSLVPPSSRPPFFSPWDHRGGIGGEVVADTFPG